MSLNLLKKNTETRFRTVDITEGSMLDPWMGYGPCKAKLSGISLDHHSQSRLTALTRGTVKAAWDFSARISHYRVYDSFLFSTALRNNGTGADVLKEGVYRGTS